MNIPNVFFMASLLVLCVTIQTLGIRFIRDTWDREDINGKDWLIFIGFLIAMIMPFELLFAVALYEMLGKFR